MRPWWACRLSELPRRQTKAAGFFEGCMKIPPEDKWFSLCVRTRSNWTCDACEKQYEPNSQGLHCSHYFSRAAKSTRWLAGDGAPVENVFAHCFGCHQKLGGNPHDFHLWMRDRIGSEDYDMLVSIHRTPMKTTKRDRKEISDHYREQYNGMSPGSSFTCAPLILDRIL